MWDHHLGIFNACLLLLNEIQRKWVYLEPVLARGALPGEQARFRSASDAFVGVLKELEAFPRLTRLKDIPRLQVGGELLWVVVGHAVGLLWDVHVHMYRVRVYRVCVFNQHVCTYNPQLLEHTHILHPSKNPLHRKHWISVAVNLTCVKKHSHNSSKTNVLRFPVFSSWVMMIC